MNVGLWFNILVIIPIGFLSFYVAWKGDEATAALLALVAFISLMLSIY
ncbi:MAG: hypothetical protein O3A46_12670 [Candidatus Poribacteria bacterium]|nr:hypothetical protein [Candidatus Poribacteria bacterium]